MRMMLKILIPTEAGNEAVKDGSLAKLFETTIRKLDAETNYFVAQDGLRCAMIFFDIRIAPNFQASSSRCSGVNVEIDVVPAMNADDLKRGLGAAMQAV
jgi:hypothetical protein